jgi:hypothetical protein
MLEGGRPQLLDHIVFYITLNLIFPPTDNAQYFTLFKLDTRRGETPILACHYIFHPKPPQSKSCTCFYVDYISFLENTYIHMYIVPPETRVLLKATKGLRATVTGEWRKLY